MNISLVYWFTTTMTDVTRVLHMHRGLRPWTFDTYPPPRNANTRLHGVVYVMAVLAQFFWRYYIQNKVMAVLAQFFWRYYLQNKVMGVLAQFYFGVLAALAQLAVLAQFYFGVSIDPPHPPGRVCTPKYFSGAPKVLPMQAQ